MFFPIQQLNFFEVVLEPFFFKESSILSLWVVVCQVTIQGAAVILPNFLKVVFFMCSVSGKQPILYFPVNQLFLLHAVPVQLHEFSEFCFSLSRVLGSPFGLSHSAQNSVQL